MSGRGDKRPMTNTNDTNDSNDINDRRKRARTISQAGKGISGESHINPADYGAAGHVATLWTRTLESGLSSQDPGLKASERSSLTEQGGTSAELGLKDLRQMRQHLSEMVGNMEEQRVQAENFLKCHRKHFMNLGGASDCEYLDKRWQQLSDNIGAARKCLDEGGSSENLQKRYDELARCQKEVNAARLPLDLRLVVRDTQDQLDWIRDYLRLNRESIEKLGNETEVYKCFMKSVQQLSDSIDAARECLGEGGSSENLQKRYDELGSYQKEVDTARLSLARQLAGRDITRRQYGYSDDSKGNKEPDFYEKWTSLLKEKGIDVPANLPDRRMPVAVVNKRYGKDIAMMFAVTRGIMAEKKSKLATYRSDIADKFEAYNTSAKITQGGKVMVASAKEQTMCLASIGLKEGSIDIYDSNRDENSDSLHLSSQLGQMYKRAIEVKKESGHIESEYRIKRLGSNNISNKETVNTIILSSKEQLIECSNRGLEKGSIDILKDSEAFLAILGTSNGHASPFLPMEYPSLFEKGQVTRIQVTFSKLRSDIRQDKIEPSNIHIETINFYYDEEA